MVNKTTYFDRAGRHNTSETLKLALSYAQQLKIRNIVIASTTGSTALKLSRLAQNAFKIICVTHQSGFAQPGKSELSPSIERKLTASGVVVLRTTHLFGGVDRAIRRQFGGLGPPEIIANTYRTFGEGTKVAVEIAVMALDAGLVPYGKDIISIAGSSRGADTALVIRPAHSHQFFDTRIRQIICKPWSF
ncbi:MAG: pyruvate kinase alpha/beta domain-containing protein [candidate division WOR-3 bacterium]